VYLCFSSKKKKKKKNDNNKAQSEKNFKSKDFSREKILKRKEFFLCLSLTSTLFFSPYIYLYHRQHTHTHTHTHTHDACNYIYARDALRLKLLCARKVRAYFCIVFSTQLALSKNELSLFRVLLFLCLVLPVSHGAPTSTNARARRE
jgi:hypothetical protein